MQTLAERERELGRARKGSQTHPRPKMANEKEKKSKH